MRYYLVSVHKNIMDFHENNCHLLIIIIISIFNFHLETFSLLTVYNNQYGINI